MSTTDITAALAALDAQADALAAVEAVTGQTEALTEARLNNAELRGQVETRAEGVEGMVTAEQYLAGVRAPSIDAEGLRKAAMSDDFKPWHGRLSIEGGTLRARRATWVTAYEFYAPRPKISLALRETTLRVIEVDLPHEYADLTPDERAEDEDYGYWTHEVADQFEGEPVIDCIESQSITEYRG